MTGRSFKRGEGANYSDMMGRNFKRGEEHKLRKPSKETGLFWSLSNICPFLLKNNVKMGGGMTSLP